jgi:hypothetical protein
MKQDYIFHLSVINGIVISSMYDFAPLMFPELAFSKVMMMATALISGSCLMALTVIVAEETAPYFEQKLWSFALGMKNPRFLIFLMNA